jgi:hypothetical protein
MTSSADSWVEHLTNVTEVRSLFPRGGLSLSGLLFLGLEYAPGNKLRIALLLDRLPEDAPQRWRDRGATTAEICLDVGVATMDVQIAKEFDELPPLDVLIGANQLSVVAQGVGDDFRLDARTFYMRLDAKASTQQ